jgi:hypothetical protein
VLGVSLLRNFAVHLSWGSKPSLTLQDEIPDSNLELAADCDPQTLLDASPARSSCLGVFAASQVGGGLAASGDETFDVPPSRLVLPLCLAPAAFDPTKDRDPGAETVSGVPALAVLATGLGTSVMSRTALERLRAAGVVLPEKRGLLRLGYGEERVSRVQLERLAVVSDETIDLGPCAELARRRRLLVAGRRGLRDDDREQNGAAVALVSTPVEFAVVDDTRPLIQGLRQELGPYVADVDVLLGGSALRHFELDVDYPAARIVLQCGAEVPPASCQVLPHCSASETPRCPGTTAK